MNIYSRFGVAILLLWLSAVATAAPLESLIINQTNAYNQHDIDTYAEYFHPDVEVYNYPDHPITASRGALIETTLKTFKERKPQTVVETTMVLKDKVVTLEQISFNVAGVRQTAKIIKIYQFQNGLIRRMTFMN
ncbi:nuclear transport factor 2 family protein [Gilvimarinus polysaccharolyticus]|uniref:nuclear transport factor 2 family protein n=1 Tax=Gilvimarinus polysaccharolyticus TaxID=863921 RepID=UPI00067378F0|nr:nuclear transport factor 2 family protein [Gilvimarinus polysaccharolyticus]